MYKPSRSRIETSEVVGVSSSNKVTPVLLNRATNCKRLRSYLRGTGMPLILDGQEIDSQTLIDASERQKEKCVREFITTASPEEIMAHAGYINSVMNRSR